MAKGQKWHTQVHGDVGHAAPDVASWDHAKALIASLDGRSRCDVFIGDVGGEVQGFLAVSGGNDGRHVIAVDDETRGRGNHWYLVRRTANDEPESVEVNHGGLPRDYPPTHVHGRATALAVAEHYFRTGRRDRRYRWQRGEPARPWETTDTAAARRRDA